MKGAILIEQLADAAWPAAEQLPLGPWKLRATGGVTRRANSVFTASADDPSAQDLDRWIADAEVFYAQRNLPPVFQISAATGARNLDAQLAARGYFIDGTSEVWTLKLSSNHRADDSIWPVLRSSNPDQHWFDIAFDESPGRRLIHEQIVQRAPDPRVFVTAKPGNEFAGCGMATFAQGHAGLFCMNTREPFRQRGIGLAMVHTLCAWAAALGGAQVFLQVMVENQPAKQLYRKAGFEFAYTYHYRVKSPATSR